MFNIANNILTNKSSATITPETEPRIAANESTANIAVQPVEFLAQ